MRIQTDGTITLEARECRVLKEAAAIVGHLAPHFDTIEGVSAFADIAADLRRLASRFGKPAPEPPEKGKGKKRAENAACPPSDIKLSTTT